MQIQIITTPEGLREAINNVVADSLSNYFKGSIPFKEPICERDLSIKQTQESLQISRATLNILLRTGQVEYYTIGRSVRIPKASIDKFKANQKA
jgi:excisionase family DNA binding protein